MIRLSALADEISPDLDEQIAVLQSEGINHLELRGVWNTNVLDLSVAQVAEIDRALKAAGLSVSALASPIGKVAVDSDPTLDLQKLDRAIAIGRVLNTTRIRIFSFYPAQNSAAPANRAIVLERLRRLSEHAEKAGVTLLHENEKDIYGDTLVRCVDLLSNLGGEHFRFLLDPANFLQCDQEPFPAAYEALKSWLGYVHVKDVDRNGVLVVAGAGAAKWPELLARLRADGYDGFFSLEPHLAEAGQFQGFSGADRFREAAQALKRLLRDMQWDFA